MTERRLALPGLELAVVEYGPVGAPTVLALHGWLDNAASFAPLAAALADDVRLIVLDLPGHGRSAHLPDPLPGRYHFTDYVDVVLAAMDALALEQSVLLGHSLGAGIASLAAAAAPARVSRLALIEGLGPLADHGEQTLTRWRKSVARASRRRSAGKRVFADLQAAVAARSRAGGLPPALAQPIVERGTQPTDGGLTWSSDARLTWPSPVRLAESQVRALLAGIECPTALLLAEPHTPYLPEAMMHARAQCVSDIAITHLRGGHHLHMEQAPAVAAWLRAFLA